MKSSNFYGRTLFFMIFLSGSSASLAQQSLLKPEIIKLAGDRDKKKLYTVRQKIPAGYFGSPYYHTVDYYVTVLSGTMRINYGEKVDTTGVKPVSPGLFFVIPAGKVHYEWFSSETLLQVHGMGPVKIIFLKQ